MPGSPPLWPAPEEGAESFLAEAAEHLARPLPGLRQPQEAGWAGLSSPPKWECCLYLFSFTPDTRNWAAHPAGAHDMLLAECVPLGIGVRFNSA